MTKDVDHRSADVERMAEHWPMIDALVGGTAAMRKAGKTFLPQWPKEDDEAYAARLQTATLFPAFTRTAGVMAAKPLSKAIQFSDTLPEQILAWLDDVDLAGTTLHAYAGQLMLACMQYGLVGVLVEHPTVEGARTVAQERAAGARPYFATYTKDKILGWRTQRGPEGVTLSQLRLMEHVKEADGQWGEKEVCQIRVLTPGAWETWRKVKSMVSGKDEWTRFDAGTTSLQKIPFVFFYGERHGFGCGHPPLLELAHQNVEHWQSASDQQTITHVARVPILFAKGFAEGDTIVIGASSAATSSSADADLKFVEHTGAAIAAGRQSLLDLEDRMRQTGAELLVQKPAVTTATQTVSEGEGNKCVLERIVETFEESLEECIELMGEWVRDLFDVELTLFKDFGAANLSDASGDLLLRANDAEIVSDETAFGQLQRMDVVAPDIKFEDEQKRIQKQPKKRGKQPADPAAA